MVKTGLTVWLSPIRIRSLPKRLTNKKTAMEYMVVFFCKERIFIFTKTKILFLEYF